VDGGDTLGDHMSDVFMSYKSEDRDRAREVAEALEGRGLSVWWDRSIQPGLDFDEEIEKALTSAKCVVVLWSQESVNSSWVKTEARDGKERKILIPAFIEDVDLPLEFKAIQTANLVDWHGDVEAPGFHNLTKAIEATLRRTTGDMQETEGGAAAAPEEPSSASNISDVGATLLDLLRKRWVQIGLAAVVGLVVVGVLATTLGGDGDGDDRITVAEAEARLADMVTGIAPTTDLETSIQICPDCSNDLARTLPDLSEFPIVVSPTVAGGAVVVEIWSSSEKSGEGTDGWIVEVAEEFNQANQQLADGRGVGVRVRKIASGTAYQFISSGKEAPQGYTPSNHLWVEMAGESVDMTPIDEQLVSNVAGIVIDSEKARELETTYGPLDAGTLIDAVINGDVVMGYTDPFVSSTGLNFLVTALDALAGGDPERILAPDVVEAFEEFQRKVPFVASTTLQLRDSVCSEAGTLDAFVMEYQTFVNTDVGCSGDFLPFGIAHDNPLYAVGDVSDDEIEALRLFATFADREEHTALAAEFGFDPPEYTPDFDLPNGFALIESQKVWKETKDGGLPVTAVFVSDISGSMEGSRMRALKLALLQGIEFISPENSVGLVLFNDQVRVVLEVGEFTGNQKGRFTAAVNRMQPFAGTAMYDGILVALDLLVDERTANPNIKPVVIVLTDGDTTAGLEFDDVSRVIAGLRIPVYTVGFEANIGELGRLASLVEAASLNASEGNVTSTIARLFNQQL
jgi:Ca-activated chloride channel family protein